MDICSIYLRYTLYIPLFIDLQTNINMHHSADKNALELERRYRCTDQTGQVGSDTSDGYHRGRHFRFSYRRLKIHFADQKQLIYCREDICWPRKNTDFHTITPLKSIYTPCQSKQQANERLQEILPATSRIYSSP